MFSRHYSKKSYLIDDADQPGRTNSGLWGINWLSSRWFLIFAIGLGLVDAFLIVTGRWFIAVGLTFLVPAVVLFSNYPFIAFIFWLLVTPFLQNTLTDQSRMIYWIVYRALPPIAVAIILLTNRLQPRHKRLQLKIGVDSLVMIGFIGWTLVNIFLYHSSASTPYIYILYDQSFVPFCLYWWIRFTAPQEQDLKKLLPVALFLVILEVLIGSLSWISPGLVPAAWVGTSSDRTIGTLGFVHAYTLTLIFFSLLLFQAALNQPPKKNNLPLLIAVGAGMAGVFLGFSRGPWLGGVLICIGLLYLYPKPVFRLIVTVVVLMVILGSTVLSKEIAFAQERLDSEQTAMVRLVIWDAGLQMIKLKPLFGWGYGDYKLYAGQFQRILYNTAATKLHASHNTFISFAAELGIPGFLLYMFPSAWWLAISLKKGKYLPKSGFWSAKLLIIFWLFILAYCVIVFFSDIRTSTYGLCLWWITLGWIATMVDPFHSLISQKA